MTETDTSENQWPREIWAFAIDHTEFEVSGSYATPEFATMPRWEGDNERDRPVQRYVDGDIYDNAERYWRVRIEALEAQLAETERQRDAARTAQIARSDVFSDTNPEARWGEDCANACPACGGSGHKDDADQRIAEAERRGAERMRERAVREMEDWFSELMNSGEVSCALAHAIRALPLTEGGE